VLLPRLDNTINYIGAELDEQDREEFFRLKKIQGKKRREKENDDSQGFAEEDTEDDGGRESDMDVSGPSNLLDATYDPDIIV
jgi:V-type H+-transporting ATPase subunit D